MSDNQALSRLQRIARKVISVIAECNDAQRRLLALRLSPDRYTHTPTGAPDTYAEFLFRTSGPLLHEPAARTRSRQRVR